MAAAKTEAIRDSWSDMVTINVPRTTNGAPNYIIASVNGRVFKIQRGVNVEVPAPIAEVLQHSFEAQNAAIEFIEKKASE